MRPGCDYCRLHLPKYLKLRDIHGFELSCKSRWRARILLTFQRFNALTIFNKMLYKSEVGGVYPMNS